MVRPDPSDPGADNWYIVEDPRQRKRIQDRLAQRARRRRLAKSKQNTSPPGRPIPGNSGSASPAAATSPQPVVPGSPHDDDDTDYIPVPHSPDMSEFPTSVLIRNDSNGEGFSTAIPMTVWAALYINGSILGLSCSTTVPAKSKPATSTVPAILHPTALQLCSIHPLWIDRFPFPRMRDNMIALIGLLEEEEFMRDLFCMSSFKIRSGRSPWDPSAWSINRAFYAKWGFLFSTDYL